jgi:hypothetical protein
MGETKGDLMELNDCRCGISHTTEHSAIQEAASFKYCLMKGEEIKVNSNMVTWHKNSYAVLRHHTMELQFFSSSATTLNEEQLNQECTNPVPLLLTHILQYVQK